MTEMLYMKGCYDKEFDADVVSEGDGYVVLDRTAFYPEGGGQPTDKGWLNGVVVTKVRKKDGEVRHYVDAPVTGKVHGKIDWVERYPHMRYHTAQHLISAIMLDKYGAETCGNQIHADNARLDFTTDNITEDMQAFVASRFNEIVDQSVPVKIFMTTREEMLGMVDERRRKLFERIPESVQDVRIIEIEGVDKCPCAGTHVANTAEVGHMTITGIMNKGSDKTRLVFELAQGQKV